MCWMCLNKTEQKNYIVLFCVIFKIIFFRQKNLNVFLIYYFPFFTGPWSSGPIKVVCSRCDNANDTEKN